MLNDKEITIQEEIYKILYDYDTLLTKRDKDDMNKDVKRLCHPNYTQYMDALKPKKEDDPEDPLIEIGRVAGSRVAHIIDTCVKALASGTGNEYDDWFTISFTESYNNTIGKPNKNDNQEIIQYLENVTNKTAKVLDSSNVYTKIEQLIKEMVMYGTGTAVMSDIPKTDKIYVDVFEWGNYVIDENSYGYVNKLIREIKSTVRNVYDKYGRDNCSKWLVEKYDNFEYNDNVYLLQAIMPVGDSDNFIERIVEMPHERVGNTNGFGSFFEKTVINAYRSSRDSKDNQDEFSKMFNKYLKTIEYKRNPIIAARWEKEPNSAYGRSLAHPNLPALRVMDMKINDSIRHYIRDKNPALQVNSDMLQSDDVDLSIGGLNYFQNGTGNVAISPIHDTKVSYEEVKNDVREYEEVLKEVFYIYDLKAISSRPKTRTATESEITEEETRKTIGRPISNIIKELQTPLINYTLGNVKSWQITEPTKLQANTISETDNVIEKATKGKHEFEIEFTSILSRMLTNVKLQKILTYLNYILPLTGSSPAVADNINWDEVNKLIHKFSGAPIGILNSKAIVDQLRQNRQNQQAQMQQLQQQQIIADINQKTAKAQKDTSLQ